MVGKECRKSHRQISWVPQVRGCKGSQGGADRTRDPMLTNAVCHAMHLVLSLKLRDHEGLALFVHGWETRYRFCIFCIISLIIHIISVIIKTCYIQSVSLSPFSSISLPLVAGWGLTENICHSVYCRPALNGDSTFGHLYRRYCCEPSQRQDRVVRGIVLQIIN